MKKVADFNPISAANAIAENGYGHLRSKVYVEPEDLSELLQFQASYFKLPADENGGNRSRAYRCLNYDNGVITECITQGYSQSAEYNYTDGGKVRRFAPIDYEIMKLPFIRKVIDMNIDIAKQIGDVDFNQLVKIGVHQVRYSPTAGCPSFSSPPWIHKDDEPIVFIHMVNISGNAIGGDSIIAQTRNTYEAVIRMVEPMETLCVTKKHFHAVTPLGVSQGEIAYRDILLITFQNIGTVEITDIQSQLNQVSVN
jgi:L-isoleucine 4-hydroxylase